MIKSLSVLIPVYNQICVNKVKTIQELCDAQHGLVYEIIVADDCSTDQDAISVNKQINDLPHCRFVLKNSNEGSGTTRNFLARQEHLLTIWMIRLLLQFSSVTRLVDLLMNLLHMVQTRLLSSMIQN